MKTIRPITLTTANLTASNVAETDYAAWSSGTTYTLGQRAIYVVGENHWVVESLQAGNLNHTPTGLTTDTWWLKVGNTNRWRMFDQSVNSQTSNANTISTTFTAAGRVDSVALLNISAASVRIKMTDLTGAPRTNLLTYSEQFDNANWTKLNAAITPNNILAPDGTLTADLFTATLADWCRLAIYPTLANTVYALSCSMKAGTHSGYLSLGLASPYPYVKFNLTDGTFILGNGAISASMTDSGDGWYRCKAILSSTSAGLFIVGSWNVGSSDSYSQPSSALNGTVYLWGAQLEAGGVATNYIPTVASPVTVNGDGVVYDETYNLSSYSGITDWYNYFYEPIIRKSDFIALDLPPYSGASIEVTLTDTGNTAYCGALIYGLSKEHGATQYGMQLGITDYSVKEQDAFGNYSILERSYRRTSEMSLWVDNTYVDQLHTTLAALRATPTIYIGSDEYGASIVYGFYKDFSTSVAYPTTSICTLTLEGLT